MEIPIEIQASIFLKDFKKIVTQERGLDIVDRKENLRSLSQMDFTKKNCKNKIKEEGGDDNEGSMSKL
jgi:hypothetical protein